MKIFLLLPYIIFSYSLSAQKIVGAAMVDGKGKITQNEKKAKYLIVLKKYNDTTFEKLEYNFAGPLQRKITYSDSSLTILTGTYAEFSENGYIASDGKYINNKKEGSWYVYDDTAHTVLEYKYLKDSVLSVIDLDSLKTEKGKIKEDTTGQQEAVYKGGDKNFMNFISKTIKIPDRTEAVSKGGTVRIRFIVNETGKPIDIEIVKSIEYALDDECMRVISLARDWIPASDKGKKLKAYRIQPISVSFK
jgi:TonB family protein